MLSDRIIPPKTPQQPHDRYAATPIPIANSDLSPLTTDFAQIMDMNKSREPGQQVQGKGSGSLPTPSTTNPITPIDLKADPTLEELIRQTRKGFFSPPPRRATDRLGRAETDKAATDRLGEGGQDGDG